MEIKSTDIIAESALTGEDMAAAADMIMRSIHRKGRDRQPEEDAPAWEQMSRFCKAGALMGNAKCMSNLAEIFYGKKTAEAVSCADSFAEAVDLWKKASELGDSRSATNLGLLHLGKPIPGAGKNGELDYDPAKALEYFIRAYDMGDMKAGRHVGLCYKDGIGTEPDDVKAYEWFEKAAVRGDSSAQLYVADCMLKGEGTEQDISEAILRYEALVECNGHDVTNAAYSLANIYMEGKYAEKNPEKAKAYLESVIRTATPHEMDLKSDAEEKLRKIS